MGSKIIKSKKMKIDNITLELGSEEYFYKFVKFED